ncbi:MAG: chemotaxis protein CheA [Eubacterium sp.]|nr:chemotaxis protein CheA [Eubacterium sp.]
MDVSQYLEIFIDETQEHIQELNDNILALENDPENSDVVNEIFRAAHSLKGMAGTMGFKRMQHLTHDMENVFQEVRSGNMSVNSDLIDVVFQCLDALEAYQENIKATSDEGTEDNEAIIQRLNEVLAAGTGAEPPAPAADAAPAAEGGASEEASGETGDKKFLTYEWDDKEKDAFNTAKGENKNVYGVTVYIDESCLLKAARAFLVFKAIEEYGEIIKYNPSSQDIEDENFETDFSFFFTCAADDAETAIKEAGEVSEVANVVYELIESVPEPGTEPAAEAAAEETSAPAVVEEKKEETKPVAKAGGSKAPAANKKANKPVTSRTVRVDIEKLDALMNQVSELIIAKNSLVSISNNNTQATSEESSQFHEQIEYLERITTNLHESVMKVRMVPIESSVSKFPRMIRDLAKTLDKPMQLVMTGEDTELDRTVVDEIGDPLQHLLRNSADHGLEDRETRLKRGKPETGTIYLNAYQEGNNVIIEVGDDGNGIDTEAVLSKGIERGIVTPEQAESMTQKEIIDLLFLPSFSMAKKISDISGRGVGLDVVKSNIEALGGDVETRTTLGEGTKFIVRLPLTLAIIQALMVEIRDEKYAISLGSIQTIEDIPISDIKFVENKEVINIRGTVIPIIRLDNLLDLPPKEVPDENLTVVIIKKGDQLAGLVVDNLIGQQEIVIKSLGDYIKNIKLISGATILGDGEVALILEVNSLF